MSHSSAFSTRLRRSVALRCLPWLGGLALAGCGSDTTTAATPPSSPQTRGDGPLSRLHLFVNPQSPAALQVAAWRAAGRIADARTIERIARQPSATWFTGNRPPQSTAAAVVGASSRRGATAELVLYDIPNRDCGGFSAGGAASSTAYIDLVTRISRGIGHNPVIVILEPDAIDQAASGCLSPAAADARYRQLAQAVSTLKANPNAHVYIDAGNSGWLPVPRLIAPLRESGIRSADGFALNVANFQSTAASTAYGRALSARLGGAHFVIDTSRNGNGPPAGPPGLDHWCNPPGRALGPAPTTNTGQRLVDAYLWVKYPGESDGQCRPDQPPAGTWWARYGLALATSS